MNCFTQHAAPANPCPACGYNEFAKELQPQHLRPRTILNGKYLLGRVLGQGGFGITYIGWDLNLDIKVAVKEYYPSGFVTREATSVGSATIQPFSGSQGDYFIRGRDKFIEEAKTLAKFFSLPGIVTIKDFFTENGTAYISMEFIEGQELKDYVIQMGGKLPAQQVFELIKPVMYSLAEVHKIGLIHRDISPDNIMIGKDGVLKLLDFGAAKDFSDSGNKSMSVMLKLGYAPEEQYRTRGNQGPWTDVYALSATIYYCITGMVPEESVERVRFDEVKPPSMLGIAIDPTQEAALMRGMAVFQEYRFQNVPELYSSLYDAQTAVSAAVQTPVTAQTAASAAGSPQAYPQQYPQTYSQSYPQQYPPPAATSTVFTAQNQEKPKNNKKKKWITAIACGLVVGFLTFAWNQWIKDGSGPHTPEPPPPSPTSSPVTPEPLVVTTPQPTPEPQEPTFVYDMPYTVKNSYASIAGTYTGDWANDKPNGFGEFINDESGSTPDGSIFWTKGSTLSGTWVDGLVEGVGEFVSSEGHRYLGEYVGGVSHGFGKYTWNDGNSYEGEFENGLPHGLGIFIKVDTDESEGYVYIGDYENGMMSGEGTVIFEDGTAYKGSFENGAFHGNVVVTQSNGDVYDVVFDDGEIVSSTKR